MTESAKRAFARKLATYGAGAAFLAIFGGGLAIGGLYWGEITFWLALFAAITCERLGTMRSTKGRWI